MLNLGKLDIKAMLALLIVLLNILLTAFQFQIYDGYISFYDFTGQWQLTAYTLKGIDPYPLIGQEHALIKSIGSIPTGWGTSPWGLLLGNIFYPGYLSLFNAKKYFVVFNIILLCLTALCLSIKLKKVSKRLGWYSFISSLFLFWPFYSIEQGNAGCGICCLLMLVILLHDTHPIFSGLILGLTMIKPQISLIICVTLLFMKSFRPVIISFVVALVSLFAISGIVNNNPVNLISEFLNAGIGNNQNYCGIFTLLLLDNKTIAMVLSMSIGILFVGVLNYLLPNDLYKPFHFYPACLVATFWSYSFNNELSILLLPFIVSVFLVLNATSSLIAMCAFFSALYLSVGSFILVYFPFLYFIFFKILSIPVLVTNNVWINMWIARTAFETGIILILFLFCFLLKKNKLINTI